MPGLIFGVLLWGMTFVVASPSRAAEAGSAYFSGQHSTATSIAVNSPVAVTFAAAPVQRAAPATDSDEIRVKEATLFGFWVGLATAFVVVLSRKRRR